MAALIHENVDPTETLHGAANEAVQLSELVTHAAQ